MKTEIVPHCVVLIDPQVCLALLVTLQEDAAHYGSSGNTQAVWDSTLQSNALRCTALLKKSAENLKRRG
jgi:hypothetical protein